MDNDQDLIEVYNILAEEGLQTFFSAFYLQMQVRRQDDFLKVNRTDLHRIGIVSRLTIKAFEKIIENLQKVGKNVRKRLDQHLPMFIVDSMLVKQDPIIINTKDVQFHENVGSGNFGQVLKGTWTRRNLNDDRTIEIPVAVKTLTDGSEMSWKKEVAIFTSLNHNHPSIIKFFGLLISDQDEVKMVTELAVLGSLLHRLRAKKITSIATLCQFAVQIATGMVFLHSKNLVHRDLSARNILVTGSNQVKITDFGLSKVLGDTENEWVMESNEMLPMRWLAPESINNGIFTTASDVWSFAVVLWEMFTFGDLPWSQCDNEEAKKRIQDGVALPEPNLCPHAVYDIMLLCFCYEADERPPFHVIRDELIAKQPETLEAVDDQTGFYDLNFKKGDYVTAIKELSEDEPDLWLGQHEKTLLFGRFARSFTTIIEYTIPLNESDTMLVPRRRSSRDVGKENRIRRNELDIQRKIPSSMPNTKKGHQTRQDSDASDENKAAECSLYENSSLLKEPISKETDSKTIEKVRPRSEVIIPKTPLVERTIKVNNLKFDSDPNILFKDTSPDVQSTVNDRITRNFNAFFDEPKTNRSETTEPKMKQSEHLMPVDVSQKAPLEFLIDSVDPFPKIKDNVRIRAISQENIYEEIPSNNLSRSQSTDALASGSSKRPRPKPLNRNLNYANQSQESRMDKYAQSVKKDFDNFAQKLDRPAPATTKLPAEVNERKISTSKLTNYNVRNQDYLNKFSHVILPDHINVSGGNEAGELKPFCGVNKAFEQDVQTATNYSDYFKQESKVPKHFTYDANAASSNVNIVQLPVTSKERTKLEVTNYTNNTWHLFDDCVKDSKKSTKKLDKSRKGSCKVNEISWPRDMSKLSQEKKEEFSSKFQKIRANCPDATVSDCLEGLRYSQNDIQRAIRYALVLKLTRLNFGFSFERCEKELAACQGDYLRAERALKIEHGREQFSFLERDHIKELLEVHDWNMKETLQTVFVQSCNEIGVTESKAKSIFDECNCNAAKALEMAKIVRLAEITSKPEHYCFRTLTRCHWKIEQAVEYIFTSNT